jgi:hypothetical protein
MKEILEEVRAMRLHGASVEYIASCVGISTDQVESALDILCEDPDFLETVGD